MVFPTVNYATGKQNCPEGFLHVPHLFYEMYWNTQVYSDLWMPDSGSQPFVLSNGDLSGCSGHGDFLAAWDTATLANIIDNCNAGDAGMDLCPGVTVRDKTKSCTVASPIDEAVTGNLTALPGDNPLEGWGVMLGLGGGYAATDDSPAAAALPTTAVAAAAIVTTAPVAKKQAVAAPEVATTFSTKSKCAHTVTVFADQAAETPAANAKREAVGHGHAHAHAHAARHQSPRHH